MQRFFIIIGLLLLSGVTRADGLPQYNLVIRNHVYQPSELKVPADARFKLVIENQDASPEEFESTEFSREKIVLPRSTVSVFVGPLKQGSYRFFGDFHQDTAQGRLIVE